MIRVSSLLPLTIFQWLIVGSDVCLRQREGEKERERAKKMKYRFISIIAVEGERKKVLNFTKNHFVSLFYY